jgi:hypothetical protein
MHVSLPSIELRCAFGRRRIRAERSRVPLVKAIGSV